MRTTLKRLCTTGAPSGFERPVAVIAKEMLEDLMDEAWIDRLGNAIGVRRCGKPNAKKLLLDAHLDEIGLVVTGIKDGFLRFATIGGVDPRMLPDRELTILTDPTLFGVVACLPPHVLSVQDREKAPPIQEFFVDTGLPQEDAERLIPIGTPMVFRDSFTPLGEHLLCSKAMDDRACFVALLRAAELLQEKELDVDLYIMGSTAEETGGSGAKVGTQAINPDFCIAVDVTHGKTPDSPGGKTSVVGGGPAVGIGPNMTRWMTKRMFEKAAAEEIDVQKEVMAGHTGTNGWGMQICNEGIATSVLSLPLKYMHTPVEVLDVSDLEQVARLIAAFTVDLGKEGGPEW
ncbi:MAG: M42 family peptidase [Clostridia bacterium]|nr:M42 family peptidase [Clostridia bacterium]